jgi:8-oxo-dGTP pyrophosphatase MutT (NUDIX family)
MPSVDGPDATAVPPSLSQTLAGYRARTDAEAADVGRLHALVSASDDPWSRSLPLHATASALIVHPPTRRVLLRWHARQNGWLHVGGHGDPGETQPLAVALREAHEETGLDDLVGWPDVALRHVAVVSVPASAREPAHEHADLRFVLATRTPDAARPENPTAALRWVSVTEAGELMTSPNLRETLARVELLLDAGT